MASIWPTGRRSRRPGACLEPRRHVRASAVSGTSLGDLASGSLINIERAMSQDERFGGHIVQGHVDATGTVLAITETEQAWIFRFQAPQEFDRYLIDKGSVSVDGISLTVVEPKDGAFDVWIIPHTFEVTNFQAIKPGDKVNLEFDVIAKYLEKILEPYIAPYRTMGIEELLAQVGQTSTITGVSAAGTPYKLTTEVEQWDEDRIHVKAEIDDCLGWGWHPSACMDRKLPELAVVGTEEWAKEGF